MLTAYRQSWRAHPGFNILFVCAMLAAWGMYALLYAAALHWLDWHYFWSLAAVLVLVAIGTFVLSKFWAFKARAA